MLNYSDQHILPNGWAYCQRVKWDPGMRVSCPMPAIILIMFALSSSMVLGTGPQIHYFFHINNFKNNVQQGNNLSAIVNWGLTNNCETLWSRNNMPNDENFIKFHEIRVKL